MTTSGILYPITEGGWITYGILSIYQRYVAAAVER